MFIYEDKSKHGGMSAIRKWIHLWRTRTQRNLFQILLNEPEIRLYLRFTIDLEQQTDIVRLLFQINQKMVNTI